MEIVIKLREDDYKRIVKEGITVFGSDADIALLERALESGTPLPKGHGALKDTDMIYAKAHLYALREFDGLFMKVNDLKNAPIIIEADKEVDE